MADLAERDAPQARDASVAREVSPEFLAILAHELRNPLAPIRNAAAALRALCTQPDQLRLVDLIARNAVSMTRLLDELLEAARLQRGRLVLQRQSVDVAELVHHALDDVRAAIESRNQSIVLGLPAGEVRMQCDPVRIEQTLRILLDNASRYTPQGGTIHVWARARDGELELEVADNGLGIEPTLLPQLFNVFAQGQRTLDRAEGGLGVGLAIARNLIELHGGTIVAESAGLNHGSRFLIRLPAGDASPVPTSAPSAASPRKPLKVLIIDDVDDNASSLAQFLITRGYDTRTANRGEPGLRLAEEFAPQAVVIDIGLPGLTGFEVARELRRRFAPGRILLIALSGYGSESLPHVDRSPFDQYLVKPADPDLIVSHLETFLMQPTGENAQAAGSQAARPADDP